MHRGELRPGSVISESALAREIGLSRTPVRHAIRQLQSEGAVEHIPGLGARVPQLGRDDLIELWELRTVLETLAARRAAKRIRPAKLKTLRELCRLFHDIADRVERLGLDAWPEVEPMHKRADAQLHRIVIEAAGSARLSRTIASLHLISMVVDSTAGERLELPRRLRLVAQQHDQIVEALAQRDARSAARLMRLHMIGAKRHHLREFDADASDPTKPSQNSTSA